MIISTVTVAQEMTLSFAMSRLVYGRPFPRTRPPAYMEPTANAFDPLPWMTMT